MNISPPHSITSENNFRLNISSPGSLDSLTFESTTRQQPGLGEVEIEVAAVGLNFKEVLIALGLVPVPKDFIVQFGLECSGKITALGAGVTDWKIGDEVITFGSSCFSKFITTPANLVALKPPHLTLEEAATIPVSFATAYYSLIKAGRLCQGESVLIHSAAGGVGMAAVQIAQWVKAEIFATAGNDEKREFLRSQGIKHVMNSRSVDFAEEVIKLTDGKGVDVVLNSLGGEFISKSLAVLARHGRFLEIGQRDILNNSQLGLRPFEKCLSFLAIQVEPKAPHFNTTWDEVIQQFQEGNFRPLPHKVFPISEVAHAFEYMTGGKHIGKIVVSLQAQEELKTTVSFKSRETVNSSVSAQKTAFLKDGLLPAEGIKAFQRILGSKLPQVVVSTKDLLAITHHNYTQQMLASQETLPKANLPQATHSRPELNNNYVAPKNEIEQTLAGIWQEILGIKNVGIQDNFFELGGDSLLIVQIRNKLQAALPVNISTADLFEYPTISTLAEYLSGEQIEESVSQQVSERAKKKEEAIAENRQLIEQRRKARS
ncbi:polyketide synthase [Tolypothrix sp. NIES-4075]|uniref:zinc-binding dehydrogenase n=1 Tax=Tolypothrix sp. NIES-4075 TaxID=2005459 RepID=UPI000B5CEB62|nr:zinc-binding dehydrogenase [Tolypothrix sp. NIES-4075]GAX42273.1 polyketide synthase [Tolypothrix sp. NIES-4075]